MSAYPAGNRRHLATSPFGPPAVERPLPEFTQGDRVTHDRYGLGSVIGVEPQRAVLVDFGAQRVRIPAPYAKLGKL